MIIDKIENMKNYPFLKDVVEVLNEKGFDVEKGKYPINEDLVLNVYEYESKEDKSGAFEAHNKWIDLQMLVKGSEYIRYAKRNAGKMKAEYNPDKDVLFMEVVNYDNLCMYAGNFAVFFPEDLHQPNLAIDKSAFVKKYVFKIRIK